GSRGAGKSALLRTLRDRAVERGRRWIDLATMSVEGELPLVDCFGEAMALREVLLLLSRVGLGEAWTYLRTPGELSEGQKWRLKLALALRAGSVAVGEVVAAGGSPRAPARGYERDGAPILACDEFAAVLDRVTAMVVGRW